VEKGREVMALQKVGQALGGRLQGSGTGAFALDQGEAERSKRARAARVWRWEERLEEKGVRKEQ
jgi:hypothetical protein